MQPLISIVMPVWNGEKYLREAIDSILSQTLTDFEFIIVDDGSTDNTVSIIRTYSDPRIRLFCLPHAGIVQALNFGCTQAQTAWLARQDADDISDPRRLESQWNCLQRNPNAILCYCNFTRFSNSQTLPRAHAPKTQPMITLLACFKCPISHETYLFSKRSFEQVGGYHEDERHAEDFGLLGRMLATGPFVCLNRDMLRVRIHPDSINQKEPTATRTISDRIALRHCQQFMNLTAADALRAFTVLSSTPRNRNRRDWSWFLLYCVPRLRTRNVEVFLWLASQTFRTIVHL